MSRSPSLGTQAPHVCGSCTSPARSSEPAVESGCDWHETGRGTRSSTARGPHFTQLERPARHQRGARRTGEATPAISDVHPRPPESGHVQQQIRQPRETSRLVPSESGSSVVSGLSISLRPPHTAGTPGVCGGDHAWAGERICLRVNSHRSDAAPETRPSGLEQAGCGMAGVGDEGAPGVLIFVRVCGRPVLGGRRRWRMWSGAGGVAASGRGGAYSAAGGGPDVG